MAKRVISQVQAAEIGCCREFTVWHFATRRTAVKFVKPWMLNHIFEYSISATLVPLCVQNVPRNIGKSFPARYAHHESSPEFLQGPCGVVLEKVFVIFIKNSCTTITVTIMVSDYTDW